MADWSGGYVSDVEYMPGFYRQLSPAHLDLACLINGVAPPDRRDGFAYLELGCGRAETTLLLAATLPEGQFTGVDFHPGHIARAEALARAGGLGNIRLLDQSFAELLADPAAAGRYDYVTLHGVYAWISDDNRRAVIEILTRMVKPGGVVCVTYNAMPGWMMAAPVQRLLLEYARLDHGRSDQVIPRAIGFLQAMQQAGAPAFQASDLIEGLSQQIHDGKAAYLAHEYLNQHWQPLFHADVARAFAAARLTYVGSANLYDNYPSLCLTRDQQDLLGQIPDPIIRETFRDYFVARTFRRDIFLRGPRHLTPEHRDHLLRRLTYGLSIAPALIRDSVTVPLGEARLEPALYQPVFRQLCTGPATIGALLDLPEVQAGRGTPVELAGMLAASAQALPFSGHDPDPAAIRRYNRALILDAQAEGRGRVALALGKVADGLTANPFEMLAYLALAAGAPPAVEPLAEAIWADLSRRGERLRHQGRPIPDPAGNLAALHHGLPDLLADLLPIWQRLGAL